MTEIKDFSECTFQEKLARWSNAQRVLEEMPEHERRKHWDMGEWGVKTECGTVACAAGHCGIDPWFRKRGLQLNFIENTNDDGEAFHDTAPDFYDDVLDFFGGNGADAIFGNGDQRPVSQVIREIKAYIIYLRAEDQMNKVMAMLDKVGLGEVEYEQPYQ